MKQKSLFILTILFVSIIAISACQPKIVEEQPTSEVSTLPEEIKQTETEVEIVDQYPINNEAGADQDLENLLKEKLMGSDHTLEFIFSQNKTREEWEKTIDRMVGYGLSITDEEKSSLIDWLINR